MRCENRANHAGRVCEMALSVQNQNRQLLLVLAIGRLQRGNPYRLTALVPVNVQVAQPARLVLEGAEPLSLPFRSCTPTGCFADMELQEALAQRLRSRPPSSRAGWNGTIPPLSFRGLAAAWEALSREGG